MRKIVFIPFLFILLFLSCGRRDVVDNNIPQMSLRDTLHLLMDKALLVDSFEFATDSLPLAYLKTGYFLDSLTKNALLIYNPADTSYTIKLYTQANDIWYRMIRYRNMGGLPAFFEIKYMDYNFDGINDIYIQTSVSNNLPISRGHLFTVDRDSLKLNYHYETKDLGNLAPDKENKVVYSQEAIIDNYGLWKYQVSAHQWEEGRLIIIRKEDPVDPDAGK